MKPAPTTKTAGARNGPTARTRRSATAATINDGGTMYSSHSSSGPPTPPELNSPSTSMAPM